MNEELMLQGIRRGEKALQHYGVLGMKWGVRKDPNKAANKAIKKLKKIENKSQKAKEIAIGNRLNSAQLERKSVRYSEKASRTVNTKKRTKLENKAKTLHAQYLNRNLKAAKMDRKAERLSRKGRNWANKMNQYLSNQTYSSVSSEDIAYARKWAVSVFD